MQLDNENLKKVLSNNIKSARLSSNLTQEQLAEISNISVNFLKDIEQCQSVGSLLTFVKLCKSLKIMPNRLLQDFFDDNSINSENLAQQISLLNDCQKNAIYTLVECFKKTGL